MKIFAHSENILENEIINPKNEVITEITDCRWSARFGLKRHPTDNAFSFNVTYVLDVEFSDYHRYRFMQENLTFYETNGIVKPDKKILLERCKERFANTHETVSNTMLEQGIDITVLDDFVFTDEEVLLAISDLIEQEFSDLN